MDYIQLTRRNGEGITINLAAVAFIENNVNAAGEQNGTSIYFIGINHVVIVKENYAGLLAKLAARGPLAPSPTLADLNRRTLEEM